MSGPGPSCSEDERAAARRALAEEDELELILFQIELMERESSHTASEQPQADRKQTVAQQLIKDATLAAELQQEENARTTTTSALDLASPVTFTPGYQAGAQQTAPGLAPAPATAPSAPQQEKLSPKK